MTETAKLAHVILPGASFIEKDGTFTNTERRVQRVRKAIEPVGNSKADWQILMWFNKCPGFLCRLFFSFRNNGRDKNISA